MNSTCEFCDISQATIHCLSCVKIHIYCKRCFDITHESDFKRSHKTQLLSTITPGQENSEEMLFCSTHSRKYKEYACLTCNQAICLDCSAIGDHVGYKIGSIPKGFEKMAEEFKANLSEYVELLKLSNTKCEAISKHLNGMQVEANTIKQKIVENSESLIKKIKEKTAESVEIVDKRVLELAKDAEPIEKSEEDLKGIIEKSNGITSNVTEATHEDY
eukprot:TRINITY_DN3354_c0_g7_i1.p1 TRINITY_DN3354_c0_g7~~TRINITY_DN3354_c0_g7_i1.p1  ORF type:complete len:217 (-),score=31.51 TRINITY_DN3354_c0_g7_i1:776-1426(-)